jgi:N-acetylglutamate synthase-like GNAT family acetyltransferase
LLFGYDVDNNRAQSDVVDFSSCSVEWMALGKLIQIRKARQGDCQSIGSVHIAAVSGLRTTLYTAEEIDAWAVPKTPESYEESIRSKEFFVAEEGGVIIGFGVLNQANAVIEAVYVSPSEGRRGVGRQILQKLEERARALGLRELTLNASLNAVPFYAIAGYVAQEKSQYRLSTGVEIACVPMVKAIDPEAEVAGLERE